MSFFNSLITKVVIGTTVVATPVTLATVFGKSSASSEESKPEALHESLTIEQLLLKKIDNFEEFKGNGNNIQIKNKKGELTDLKFTISKREDEDEYNWKIEFDFNVNNRKNKWICNIEFGYKFENNKFKEKLGFSNDNKSEFTKIDKSKLNNVKKVVEICSKDVEDKDVRNSNDTQQSWRIYHTSSSDEDKQWLEEVFPYNS